MTSITIPQWLTEHPVWRQHRMLGLFLGLVELAAMSPETVDGVQLERGQLLGGQKRLYRLLCGDGKDSLRYDPQPSMKTLTRSIGWLKSLGLLETAVSKEAVQGNLIPPNVITILRFNDLRQTATPQPETMCPRGLSADTVVNTATQIGCEENKPVHQSLDPQAIGLPKLEKPDPEPEKPDPEPDYAKELIARWNATPGVAPAQRMTAKRRASLHARMAASAKWWDSVPIALERVSASSFCRGGGNRGWVADLDWFLRPDTMVHIFEGRYDDRARQQGLFEGSVYDGGDGGGDI